MIDLTLKLNLLDDEKLNMFKEGDLYFNESVLESSSKHVNDIFLTALDILDIFEKSDVSDLDNPFKVTYMCEEDYDGLYELQEALMKYGFLNNRTYANKYSNNK